MVPTTDAIFSRTTQRSSKSIGAMLGSFWCICAIRDRRDTNRPFLCVYQVRPKLLILLTLRYLHVARWLSPGDAMDQVPALGTKAYQPNNWRLHTGIPNSYLSWATFLFDATLKTGKKRADRIFNLFWLREYLFYRKVNLLYSVFVVRNSKSPIACYGIS